MENTTKNRSLFIGVAGFVGLAALVYVGWNYANRLNASKTTDPKTQQVLHEKQKVASALHQLCAQADMVGVDTSRYTETATESTTDLRAKHKRLALEMRYGKKPSRLSFAGLAEQMDTAGTTTEQVESPTFAPYIQLVSQYKRLRQANASPDSLRLIRQTLNFYRYINRFAMDKFVIVNIPASELNIFDRSGQRLLPMQVIVGKKDKKTPCMATYVSDTVTYPYWNVPKSIAIKEMLPKIRQNLSYLDHQNLQVLDAREQEVDPATIDWASMSATNFPYRIRQASGCSNSLGLIKFNIANPFAIYLHDTNSRDLFTGSCDRYRSHGCVRVQKPVELANFVLNAQVFDQGYMDRCLIDQKPKTLKLPKPFPVFIVYNTADIDAAGKLRFYNDIYALDK